MQNWTGNCLISNLIPTTLALLTLPPPNAAKLWSVLRFHNITKAQSNHRFKHTFYHHLCTHDWDALQLLYTFNNVMGWVVLYSHRPHCKENPIYVFPEMKLRCLVPSFHICGNYKSLTETWMWKLGTRSFLGIFVSNFWYVVFTVWGVWPFSLIGQE